MTRKRKLPEALSDFVTSFGKVETRQAPETTLSKPLPKITLNGRKALVSARNALSASRLALHDRPDRFRDMDAKIAPVVAAKTDPGSLARVACRSTSRQHQPPQRFRTEKASTEPTDGPQREHHQRQCSFKPLSRGAHASEVGQFPQCQRASQRLQMRPRRMYAAAGSMPEDVSCSQGHLRRSTRERRPVQLDLPGEQPAACVKSSDAGSAGAMWFSLRRDAPGQPSQAVKGSSLPPLPKIVIRRASCQLPSQLPTESRPPCRVQDLHDLAAAVVSPPDRNGMADASPSQPSLSISDADLVQASGVARSPAVPAAAEKLPPRLPVDQTHAANQQAPSPATSCTSTPDNQESDMHEPQQPVQSAAISSEAFARSSASCSLDMNAAQQQHIGWQSGVQWAAGLQSPRVKPMKRAYRRRLKLGLPSPDLLTTGRKARCGSRTRHMPRRMELDMASQEELAELDQGEAAELDWALADTGEVAGIDLNLHGRAAAKEVAGVRDMMARVSTQQQAAVWQHGRRRILRNLLKRLTSSMAARPFHPQPQAKPTAGVSYLVASASRQEGAPGGPPLLPHLVIRPPNLTPAKGPVVDHMLHFIVEQATAAVILPLRDDACIKQFLLDPPARTGMLGCLGGCLRMIQGAKALASLLTDKVMVCLMYCWTAQEGLQACSSSPEAASGRSWWQSNVQLGVAVRKGVGGTCPARAAARNLAHCGLLELLLDPPPMPSWHATAPPVAAEASPAPVRPSPITPSMRNAPVHTMGSRLQSSTSAQLPLAATELPASGIITQTAIDPNSHFNLPSGPLATDAATAKPSFTCCTAGFTSAAVPSLCSPGLLDEQAASSCIQPPLGGACVPSSSQKPSQSADHVTTLEHICSTGADQLTTTGPATLEAQHTNPAAQSLSAGQTLTIVSPDPASFQLEGLCDPTWAPHIVLSFPDSKMCGIDQTASAPAGSCSSLAHAGDIMPQSSHAKPSEMDHLPMSTCNEASAALRPSACPAADTLTVPAQCPPGMAARPSNDDANVAAAWNAPTAADPTGQGNLDTEEPADEWDADELMREAQAVETADHVASSVVSAPSSHPRLKLYTLSCRLEMYIAEQTWHSCPRGMKDTFTGVMAGLERYLAVELSRHSQDALAGYVHQLNEAVEPMLGAPPSCSLQNLHVQVPGSALSLDKQLQTGNVQPDPAALLPSSQGPRAERLTQGTSEDQGLRTQAVQPPLGSLQACRSSASQAPVREPTAAVSVAQTNGVRAQDVSASSSRSLTEGMALQEGLLGSTVNFPADPCLPSSGHCSHQHDTSLGPCSSAGLPAEVESAPDPYAGPQADQRFVVSGRDRLGSYGCAPEHTAAAAASADSSVPGPEGNRDPARELAEAAGAAVAAEASERAAAGPFPWPLYLIGTRDCFTNHLIPITEQVLMNGCQAIKTTYFFRPGEAPENYGQICNASTANQPLLPAVHHELLQPGAESRLGSAVAAPQQDAPAAGSAGSWAEEPMRIRAPGCTAGTKGPAASPIIDVLSEMDVTAEARCDAACVPRTPTTHSMQLAGVKATETPTRLTNDKNCTASAMPAAQGLSEESSNPNDCASPGPPEECRLRGRQHKSSLAEAEPSQSSSPGLLPVGITTYTGIFSEGALEEMERGADAVDAKARAGKLPAECWHTTLGRGGLPRRTKFFFGARYLWTRDQLASAAASHARGIRADVPPPPSWIQGHVEQALVQADLVKPGFFNSWALNLYHDGSEGIQSHYDDPDRFEQPIYSLRLFSDSRLSFGTQLYGYTNGAFCIDMPRGCVTVMERGGYAANGIKHCVRPVDMTGKSAGLILRRMNAAALAEARCLLVEQVTQGLARLSLLQSLGMLPGDADPRPNAEATIEQDIRKVLDGCIRSLEPRRGRGRARGPDDGPILKVMDRMLHKVERLVVKEQRQAQEVTDVLDRMVMRVHCSQEADRLQVQQVMDRIVGRVCGDRHPQQLGSAVAEGHVIHKRKKALLDDLSGGGSKRLKQQHTGTSQHTAHWPKSQKLPRLQPANANPAAMESQHLASLLASLPVQLTRALPGIIQQAVHMTCKPGRRPAGSNSALVQHSEVLSQDLTWQPLQPTVAAADDARYQHANQPDMACCPPSAAEPAYGAAQNPVLQTAQHNAGTADFAGDQKVIQTVESSQPHLLSAVQHARGSSQPQLVLPAEQTAASAGSARHQNAAQHTEQRHYTQPSQSTKTSLQDLMLSQDCPPLGSTPSMCCSSPVGLCLFSRATAFPEMRALAPFVPVSMQPPNASTLLGSFPSAAHPTRGIGQQSSVASTLHEASPSGASFHTSMGQANPGGCPVALKQEPAVAPAMGNTVGHGRMAGNMAVTHALRTPEVAACVLQLLQPHLPLLSAEGSGGCLSSAALVGLLQQLAQGGRLHPPLQQASYAPDHHQQSSGSDMHLHGLPIQSTALHQHHQGSASIPANHHHHHHHHQVSTPPGFASWSSPNIANSVAQGTSPLPLNGGSFSIGSSPQPLRSPGRKVSVLDRLATSSRPGRCPNALQATSLPAYLALSSGAAVDIFQHHAQDGAPSSIPEQVVPSLLHRLAPSAVEGHSQDAQQAASASKGLPLVARPLAEASQQYAWEACPSVDLALKTRPPADRMQQQQQQQHAWEGAAYGPPAHLLHSSHAVPPAAWIALGQLHARAGVRATLSSAPLAVCASCYSPGGDLSGQLWSCSGPCRSTFHGGCQMQNGHPAAPLCGACSTGRHSCGLCGRQGNDVDPVFKCSMKACGRHYHTACAAACPLTHFANGNLRFRCPVHYCAACGTSGDSVPMCQCTCCPHGFHVRCKPKTALVLTRKLILCPNHH
ncbi:hypothetical protein WJX74_000510 [Apatococcus lobatus]|uniref:Zinc finger PHD-type domain-containing protein n=1 Tax=Apatococcus lobatus TaxID=904363 RepID=A0AAW1RK31_9CHLO